VTLSITAVVELGLRKLFRECGILPPPDEQAKDEK
jgi:hypothetical protein